MTPVREVQITFDCADPHGLAGSWNEALGYTYASPPSGFESWYQALDAFGCLPTSATTRRRAWLLRDRVPR